MALDEFDDTDQAAPIITSNETQTANNKPNNTYPIIKDIHNPKFTEPPPKNTEANTPQGQDAKNAQYQLNIYQGHYRKRRKKKLSNREIGSRYERYLAYLYERAGWKVDYHGEKNGVNDGGIDLICYTLDSELCHVIQAKHWSRRKIDTQDIEKFIADFENIRPCIPHKHPEAVFITSGHFTQAAKDIAEAHFIHTMEKVAMAQDYPLVKCLYGKDNTKIYLIPPIIEIGKYGTVSDYVYYSANFSQGDCYVYTAAEAERRGLEWLH